MAYWPYSAVQEADVAQASRSIDNNVDQDDIPQVNQFGSAFNYWQKPITDFGSVMSSWPGQIQQSPYVGEMDFGRKEWARARDTVDAVMDLLLKELREKASRYEHLRIDSYVRQGSSRDGLKVIAPDEFDAVLEFHLEGLKLTDVGIFKGDKYIPGFCYLQVEDTLPRLQQRYPRLFQKDIFVEEGGYVYLSSSRLHQSVFESLIDQCCQSIEEKIMSNRKQGKPISFNIRRVMNPPAVSIKISYNDDATDLLMRQGQVRQRQDENREIDLDIVPAWRLKVDETTQYYGKRVNAVKHAVCKWKEENASTCLEISDQRRIWHINSAGYERFILDVARTIPKQRYILTALRILKTCFTKLKASEMRQKVNIVKSYHLKQLALYLIFYAGHVHTDMQINDARKALLLLIALLISALGGKHLPHFFYSSSQVARMLPNYPAFAHSLRFDLFRKISSQALEEARTFVVDSLQHNLGFGSGNADPDALKLRDSFDQEIQRGGYF